MDGDPRAAALQRILAPGQAKAAQLARFRAAGQAIAPDKAEALQKLLDAPLPAPPVADAKTAVALGRTALAGWLKGAS